MKYLRLFETHAQYEAFLETADFLVPNVSRCRASNDVHYNPIPETRLIVTYNIVSNSGGGGIYTAESMLKSTSTPTVTAKIMNYFDKTQYEEDYGEGSAPFTKDIKAVNIFDKIEWNGLEIDPAELDAEEGYWNLPTGTQVIKYTLKDPTTIPEGLFVLQGSGGGGNVEKIALKSTNTFGRLIAVIKVEIPNSVTTIEQMAFASCYDLTTIKFGTGITTIDDYVFCGCQPSQFDNATGQALSNLAQAEIASQNIFNCPNYSGGGTIVAAAGTSKD